ncbi:MAG TPA: hypothetical protein VNA25_03215 [Phycisphaerae bacterium]|nr:hypothetical protein [Phycisphaerae bacterium]
MELAVGVVGLAIGIIGVLLAITVAVRSRQISRPSMRFHVGLLFERGEVPPKLRGKRTRLFLFGTPEQGPDWAILACPYVLENTGKLPISELIVQFVYPTDSLLDSALVIDQKAEIAAKIKLAPAQGREVLRLGDTVQVAYRFPVLNPGQKTLSCEFLKVGRMQAESLKALPLMPTQGNVAAERFAQLDKFLGTVVVRIDVWSATCPPIAEEVVIFWFNAVSLSELETVFRNLSTAIWDGQRPKPGLYRKRRHIGIVPRVELAELVIPRSGVTVASIRDGVSAENVLSSERAMGWIEVPPWGYFGRSFDLTPYLRPVLPRILAKVSDKARGGE